MQLRVAKNRLNLNGHNFTYSIVSIKMYKADQFRDVKNLNTVNHDILSIYTLIMVFVIPIYLHARELNILIRFFLNFSIVTQNNSYMQ